SLCAELRLVRGFQSLLRPSVMVVPVRGSGWRVCLSAAGFRVHDPGASQASSTPASWNKGTGEITSKITGKINFTGKVKSQIKVKNCDEEPGASGGGSWLPRGTGAIP
ncbi:hypothetical protein, partial [Catenulispora pinisilvae]|uniref:hypothetical protein n=1 Tax=Catenulispora pinisilvae TaxID=2705253 RepID=UPI001E3EEBBB